MQRTRTSTAPCRMKSVLEVGVVLAALLVLTLAAPAFAQSGRVGTQQHRTPWAPGKAAASALRDSSTSYGIWDAQPTGALVYTRSDSAPEMTLTATDATGKTAWSVAGGDVWAASATLPAAFVAVYAGSDPNVLRSGELRAYKADGTLRFHKAFKSAFVQPLCDTQTRLVWVEVSAKKVTRVFVRQGSRTRSLALGYRPPQASFPNPTASSTNGGRLAVGAYMHKTDRWRTMMYWLRVSGAGVPRVVSHAVTDWPYLAMSPDGTKAAVISDRNPPEASRNLWVDFGKFSGRLLPGDPPTEMEVGPQRIFEMGGYGYGNDSIAWNTSTVAVIDWSMQYAYQRAWTWNNSTDSIWFRHDPAISYLAGIDTSGALTAINVDTWAMATVPGTYADALPVAGGRVATITPAGVLNYIVNPVAGP